MRENRVNLDWYFTHLSNCFLGQALALKRTHEEQEAAAGSRARVA
jgi:hypothetical protein